MLRAVAHVVNKLRPRHYAALHLALLGRSHVEIAFRVGMTPGHVGDLLRSPLARAELGRLRTTAETKLATLRDTQSDLRKKKAALESQLNSLMERIEF